MIPLTLLSVRKLSALLTSGDALQNQISGIVSATGIQVPDLTSDQVLLTSANQETADMDLNLIYPRVCLYSSNVKNTQSEKFRSFSGTLAVVADIWTSADLVTQVDLWTHIYVEAVTDLLRRNIGDWGDGIFFGGKYEVQFQTPKSGGFGSVLLARLTCTLNASLN